MTGTRTATYREALREALREELTRDERVLVLGEDVGTFGGAYRVTEGLLDAFGAARVRDAPPVERTLVGVGAGAALVGLRPVVELMSVGAVLRALDQLVVAVAQASLTTGGQRGVPLVIRTPQIGAPQLGPTHVHDFAALLAHVPGLIVAAPSTARDAHGLLKAAVRSDDPVVLLEHDLLYGVSGEIPDDPEHLLPFGQAALRREGRDVTIAGLSHGAHLAVQAADLLEREHGVSAEVLDLRTARPLDVGSLAGSVARTNRLMVVDEGWPFGGLAATVAAALQSEAFDDLDGPILRVGGADAAVPYAATAHAAARPGPRGIAAQIAAALR